MGLIKNATLNKGGVINAVNDTRQTPLLGTNVATKILAGTQKRENLPMIYNSKYKQGQNKTLFTTDTNAIKINAE